MASEKHEIEILDEDVSPAAAADKRIKIEPKYDDESSEEDSAVVSDKQRITELLMDLENDEQAKKAFKELADLCWFGENEQMERARKNRENVFRLGGPIIILGSMKRHKLSPDILAEGFRALGHALCPSKKHAELTETVIGLGGIETAIGVMSIFHLKEYIQLDACLLLANLSLVKDAATRIADHPVGILTIVDAMNRFPDHEDLQRFGCRTLENISQFNITSHNDKIIQAGGLVALAEAKTKHPNNARIHDIVRTTMKHLFKFEE